MVRIQSVLLSLSRTSPFLILCLWNFFWRYWKGLGVLKSLNSWVRKQVLDSRKSGDGALATFLLTALKGKRQVWVLLIPQIITDEKPHEMAGQLCRSQSGTLAKITEIGGGAVSIKYSSYSLAKVSKKNKKRTNPDCYNQCLRFKKLGLHSLLWTMEGCQILSQFWQLLVVWLWEYA